MHVPQVRDVRQHREPRRAVHPPSQHRQREDLHLHLVLVPGARPPLLPRGPLQVHHHLQPLHQSLHPPGQVQVREDMERPVVLTIM